MNIKGKGQRLIPEELLRYLQEVKNTYPEALEIVSANPTLSGDESALESVEIKGVKYSVGGGGGKLYLHKITLPYNNNNNYVSFEIISKKNSAYTYSEIVSWLSSLHASAGWQGGVCCSTTDLDSTIFPLGIGQDSEVYIEVFYWDGTKVARETLTNLGITVYDYYIEV